MRSSTMIHGRYQIVRELGHGAMGEVYLARDLRLNRDVAIKLLQKSNKEADERFKREAYALAQVDSQHVVTVLDAAFEDEPHIVMKFVAGSDLSKIISQANPNIDKLALFETLCIGLSHIHERGIVHRDIKPANIIVAFDGRPIIVDFGIARTAEVETITADHAWIGTPNYMSPEQVNGHRVDQRSDLFSVGAVAYELFCGRKAFPLADRTNESLLGLAMRITKGDFQPLDTVAALDERTVAIVKRCLTADVDARYQSAMDVVADIRVARASLEQQGRDVVKTPVQSMPGQALRSSSTRPRRDWGTLGTAIADFMQTIPLAVPSIGVALVLLASAATIPIVANIAIGPKSGLAQNLSLFAIGIVMLTWGLWGMLPTRHLDMNDMSATLLPIGVGMMSVIASRGFGARTAEGEMIWWMATAVALFAAWAVVCRRRQRGTPMSTAVVGALFWCGVLWVAVNMHEWYLQDLAVSFLVFPAAALIMGFAPLLMDIGRVRDEAIRRFVVCFALLPLLRFPTVLVVALTVTAIVVLWAISQYLVAAVTIQEDARYEAKRRLVSARNAFAVCVWMGLAFWLFPLMDTGYSRLQSVGWSGMISGAIVSSTSLGLAWIGAKLLET